MQDSGLPGHPFGFPRDSQRRSLREGRMPWQLNMFVKKLLDPSPHQQPDPFEGGGSGGWTGSGAGNGGDNNKRDDRSDDEDNDDADDEIESIRADLQSVLREESRSPASLPRDIRQAVRTGVVSESDLLRFFVVEKMFIIGSLARAWPALRNRLVANPRFMTVMAVELVLGVVSKTMAEWNLRGERFWNEFDFYLSDIALEVVGDFALVWLLSPSLRTTESVRGALAAPFGWERASLLLKSLPSFALQEGTTFTLAQRTGNLALKAVQFGVVGFTASVIGHSFTKALVQIRRNFHPNTPPPQVELAPTLSNSIAWASFMACSSNVRYQLVNAAESRLLEPLFGNQFPALMTAASFLLRFANTYVGGLHWIPWAKRAGVQ